MNQKFIEPSLEILNFVNEDIIVTSNGSGTVGNWCDPSDTDYPNCL